MSSNRPVETPLGKPVRVGACGYQIYSESWPDGNTTFYAKVGQYYEKSGTGEIFIIPKLRLNKASDHKRAEDEAEKGLGIIESSRQVILQREKSSPKKLGLVADADANTDLNCEAA